MVYSPSDGLTLVMVKVLISHSSGCRVALLFTPFCDGPFSCWLLPLPVDGLLSLWGSETSARGVCPNCWEGTRTLTSVYSSCLLSLPSRLSGLTSLLTLPWPFLTGDLPRSGATSLPSGTDNKETSSNHDVPFSPLFGEWWCWRQCLVRHGDTVRV